MFSIEYTENFGYCMDIINAAENPYHIVTLKKHMDKAELKMFVMKLIRSAS